MYSMMVNVVSLILVVLCVSPPQLEAASRHCDYHGHYYTRKYSGGCTTYWYKVYYGYCTYGYLTSDAYVHLDGYQLYYFKKYCYGKRSEEVVRENLGNRVKKHSEEKRSVKNVQKSDYDTILKALSSGTVNKRDLTGLSTNVPE